MAGLITGHPTLDAIKVTLEAVIRIHTAFDIEPRGSRSDHGFDKIDQGRSGRTGARNVDCGLKVSSMLVRVGDPVNDYFSLDTFAGVVQPSSLK